MENAANDKVYEKARQNPENCSNDEKRKYEIVHIKNKNDPGFMCKMCDRKFAIKGEFKRHIERHYKKKKQHKCKKCTRMFLTVVGFRSHKC